MNSQRVYVVKKRMGPHPAGHKLSSSPLPHVAPQPVCTALSAAVARFPSPSCTESSPSMWGEQKMLSSQPPTTGCTSSLRSLSSTWVWAATSLRVWTHTGVWDGSLASVRTHAAVSPAGRFWQRFCVTVCHLCCPHSPSLSSTCCNRGARGGEIIVTSCLFLTHTLS